MWIESVCMCFILIQGLALWAFQKALVGLHAHTE
jgi:hypothetical protein